MVSYQNLIMSNISHVNATGTWYSELQTPSAKLQTPNSELTEAHTMESHRQTGTNSKSGKKGGGQLRGSITKFLPLATLEAKVARSHCPSTS